MPTEEVTLEEVLEMVQSGTVNIGGRYAVDLIKSLIKARADNKALRAENTRLKAPLSPEECEEHGERDKDVEGSPYIFTAGDFEAILVSRYTTPIPRSTQCETQP